MPSVRGPQCDFSQSLKQWHSTVWLNDKDNRSSPFGSQVMASAPKALEKLDQKRETLKDLKNVLARKIENKHKNREKKLLRKEHQRAASVMERPTSGRHVLTQERSASAMLVHHKTNSLSKRINSSISEGKTKNTALFFSVLLSVSFWKYSKFLVAFVEHR